MESNVIEVEIDVMLDEVQANSNSNQSYAYTLATQALSLAESSNYDLGIARAQLVIGNIERNKGHHSKALQHYQTGLECYQSIGAKDKMAVCYNNMGIIYFNLGMLESALDHFLQALDIQIQLNNLQSIALYKNNIGAIYSKLKKQEQAIKNYQEALEINISLNNQTMIVKNYINLGTSAFELNTYEEAIDYFKKALTITELIDADKMDIAMINSNIAINLKELQRYEEGLSYAEIAYQTSMAEENKNMLALSAGILGFLKFKTNAFEDANNYLQQALQASIEVENIEFQIDILDYLSAYYQSQDKWKEAFETTTKKEQLKNELKMHELLVKVETKDLKDSLHIELNNRKATEEVLYNTLPKHIAERIKNGEQNVNDKHEHCCVLFLDIVGFTTWSSTRDIEEVAHELNKIFENFDMLCTMYEVEKIKTIGDAYLCVNGISEKSPFKPINMAQLASAMQEKILALYPAKELQIRIGIHTGSVIAGVLGKNKLAFDIWGDTVNTASRMESTGVASKIHISEDFMQLIQDAFTFEQREIIEVKGKGAMQTYFLI